ncbi:hypothetical protein [Steroidobacter sp.]|uniref:hypothetical protein n=1 Tax=Steroidobacter sp. TaxID=1978227 RepID=UPI001A50062B|nr:hypothetical protein [Steroidobacter sp.]MBL8268157.1 hypothetical protein [Steroidobacter sp.]
MKKNTLGVTRLLPAVTLAFGMLFAGSGSAQESALSFVVSTPDRQCDEFNRSWVVSSTHTYLSIKVQAKWSAVGAKEMQEEFILSPGSSRAIGCAAKLEIVAAEILQF